MAAWQDGGVIQIDAALLLHLAASILALFLGVEFDRALRAVCARPIVRVVSGASFLAFVALPLNFDFGPARLLLVIPGLIAGVWAFRFAPRSEQTRRRLTLLLAYQRLYALLGTPPSVARRDAALTQIRSLDGLHGSPDDELARLMQSSFSEELIERKVSDDELLEQAAIVSRLLNALDC